jgi:hypothetical protein
MKNIHVLPTEKRSNLFKDINGKLGFHKNWIEIPIGRINQNIYITNSEKPKAGEWSLYENKIHKCIEDIIGDEFKKIILTTDQDLIADGVQAINDEFLEWFVKNPSCEEVEVEREKSIGYTEDRARVFYGKLKIIIPKEIGFKVENGKKTETFYLKQEPKQEKICTGCGTLSSEELGKNKLGENFLACCPDSDYVNVQEYQEYGLLQHIKFCLECGNETQAIRLIEKYGFEKQEQDNKMYSEEDMVKAIYFGANGMYGYQIGEEGYTINQIKKFLQQFKNK